MLLQKPYVPFSSQESFHRGRERVKYFSGGWGAGKTTAGAYEALKLAVKNKGCIGFIAAPTYVMLKRVTLPAFFEVLPREWIKREQKQERLIELWNGSKIYYGSTDRPYTLEGTNLAWFWLDEGRFASLEAFNILLGRTRVGNATRLQSIVTSTPAPGWLYEEFGTGKKDRGLYVGRTIDNPHLDDGFVDNLKITLSEYEYKMYVLGIFVNPLGDVFPNFSPDTHCQDLEINEDYPIHCAIDFGFRMPACLFIQTIDRCPVHQQDDCVHVLDEIMPENTPTSELADMIVKKTRREHWRVRTCYVDPAGRARNTRDGLTDVSALEARGFACAYTMDPKNRNIPNGIATIRSKLMDYQGNISMYFHNKLRSSKRGIVPSLMKSAYKKNNVEMDDTPVKDGIYDHARDALRYYLVNLFPVSVFLHRNEVRIWK